MFSRFRLSAIVLAGALAAPGAGDAAAQTPVLNYAAQGWTATDRETFYTTSQGSHIMPYTWFKALRRDDVDELFAADQLQRYGYLRNDAPYNTADLPVGFIVDGSAPQSQIGMTCAACHTGQLEYQKDGQTFAIRLDGAPANADFEQFLVDLRSATRATLAQADRFTAFAKAVLGTGFTTAKAAQLKTDFATWVKQYGDFMDASLPTAAWGPGRLDAFGMIFNRVSARDLGVIANFKTANAPVSYPFLWNAVKQDHTQWNGGVPNGLYVQGLARNTGEVLGVFADFKPRVVVPASPLLPAVISNHNTSVVYAGLQTLEKKIAILAPPPWPRDVFGLDTVLADKGKPLYEQYCGGCHGEKVSPSLGHAWVTPVAAVGTDPKMVVNSGRKSDPGLYLGALMPPPAIGNRFANPASTTDLLAAAVVGGLLDDAFNPPVITPGKLANSGVWRAIRRDVADLLPDENVDDLADSRRGHLADLQALVKLRLAKMYTKPVGADPGAAYESRVLHGIWATAPYLHNGSVPNLWELLTPAAQRKTVFKVGSRVYDTKNVGYVTDQTPFANGTFETDPNNVNGNGNGGHEFGTTLTPDERWAIIEYMKML